MIFDHKFRSSLSKSWVFSGTPFAHSPISWFRPFCELMLYQKVFMFFFPKWFSIDQIVLWFFLSNFSEIHLLKKIDLCESLAKFSMQFSHGWARTATVKIQCCQLSNWGLCSLSWISFCRISDHREQQWWSRCSHNAGYSQLSMFLA